MKIGVISDTHNYFDPQISELFSDVEHILHAGDVGKPSIILELEQIAPVTVVMGNNDHDFAAQWKETEVVTLDGIKFLVHHIIQPGSLSEVAERQVKRHKPDVVVFGHSHQPFEQTIGKTLYFNPGYAGKPRFGQQRTLAILETDKGSIVSRNIPL